MLKWAVLIALTLAAIPASAQQDVRVVKPDELSQRIHAEQPYGAGDFTFWTVKVYDASLWTDAHRWSMQEPFALTLRYAIAIDKEKLVDSSIDEMEKVGSVSAEQADDYRRILQSSVRSVKNGDTITAFFEPGKRIEMFHNGQLTGSSDNLDFARTFMDVWLSPRTSAPELRRHLLRQD